MSPIMVSSVIFNIGIIRLNVIFCSIFLFMYLGENYILIVAGANGTLQKEDVDKADNLLLSETSVVLFQFETPLETTEYLLNKLSNANSKCE